MITTQQLRQGLLGAAAISVVGVACSNRLRDYTQLTLKATAKGADTEITADSLDETKGILEKRLAELGLGTAELETVEPDQLIVRLPEAAAIDMVSETLTRVGQLTLRSQKPDTEDELGNLLGDTGLEENHFHADEGDNRSEQVVVRACQERSPGPLARDDGTLNAGNTIIHDSLDSLMQCVDRHRSDLVRYDTVYLTWFGFRFAVISIRVGARDRQYNRKPS